MSKQAIWQGTEVTARQKAYSRCALLLNRKLMLIVISEKMDCTMQCDRSLGFRQTLGLIKKHLEDEWPKQGNCPLLGVIEQWITRVFWQTNIVLLWCRHYWQADQLAVPELSVSLASERLLCIWTLLDAIKRSHSSPEWCTRSELCYAPCSGDCTESPGCVSILVNAGRALITFHRGVPPLVGAEWRS